MKFKSIIWLMGVTILFFSQTLRAETIYTANEAGSSVSIIEWPGNGESKVVPVPDMPHNVDIAGKNKFVMATGMKGVLLLLDSKGSLLKTIAVGEHPAHVIADKEGIKAYVTLSGEDTVAVIDLETGKIEKKISVGKYPHGLRMSTDGTEIYVANMKDDTVSILSVPEQKEIVRIIVGQKPVQVAVTPEGKTVYVSLNAENAVAAIDIASRKVLKKILVDSNPVQLIAARDRLFVANQGSRVKPGETVTVIDTLKNETLATIPVGKGPHGVAVSSDAKTVFVSNVYEDTISVIDAEKMVVVKTIPVGKQPNGITVSW